MGVMSVYPSLGAQDAALAVPEWQAAAWCIDHTLLRPEASRGQVVQLCDEAEQYGFACVMINPTWVSFCASRLRESPVKTGVVIGFPLGASVTTAKRLEAEECLRLGADELDMVMNIGALKSGDHALVETDIRTLAETCHQAGAILKVILECALLTNKEKEIACQLALAAGADFVKTSTGFSTGGATLEDVALLRRVVGDRCRVKAAGGVRNTADFAAMLKAGADRIGTSASVNIMRELGAPGAPGGPASSRSGY
jgi:deoxyribose-phosphate aldolase